MTALPFLGAMVSEMEIGGEITDEGSLAMFAAIRRASSRVAAIVIEINRQYEV
jgi:hypothetical protein